MGFEDEFDVGEGASAPSDKLEVLHRTLEETIALDEATRKLEEDLKAAKSTLHTLRTSRIPDLMAEMQMDSITFRGWKVKVDDFVSGSLPKDEAKREKAIRWLEDHDAASLIKTQLSLAFAKSQHNEALSVAASLEEKGFAPKVESSVHASTLKSYALERIRSGDEIDPETLGLYVGKTAKMSEVKS